MSIFTEKEGFVSNELGCLLEEVPKQALNICPGFQLFCYGKV